MKENINYISVSNKHSDTYLKFLSNGKKMPIITSPFHIGNEYFVIDCTLAKYYINLHKIKSISFSRFSGIFHFLDVYFFDNTKISLSSVSEHTVRQIKLELTFIQLKHETI